MTIPFCYHLYHKPTNTRYYGVRYRKNCHPDQLWKTYFSSSSIVKQLILEYGKESFVISIRKIFDSSDKALLWEHKVLRRLNVSDKSNWLNQHNGGKKFRPPTHHTDETKKKIGLSQKGIPKSKIQKERMSKTAYETNRKRKESGWHMTKQSRKNISDGVKLAADKIYTPERNIKMAESKRGKKKTLMPDGSYKFLLP